MYLVKALDPLYDAAEAALTARKLAFGFDTSTPSEDFTNMSEKIGQFVERMVDFIEKERWKKIPQLAPTDGVQLIDGVPLMTDPSGNVIFHEYRTISDWLAARWDHGGASTGPNYQRLIKLMERVANPDSILKAIADRDVFSASKIKREVEKRQAKQFKLKQSDLITPQAQQTPAVAENGEIGRGRDSYSKNENGIAIRGGNNSAYRIAKLKRDHPEVAARIAAGEFKSVSEAERSIGLRPPKLTALERVQRAYAKLSENDRNVFREWLGEAL